MRHAPADNFESRLRRALIGGSAVVVAAAVAVAANISLSDPDNPAVTAGLVAPPAPPSSVAVSLSQESARPAASPTPSRSRPVASRTTTLTATRKIRESFDGRNARFVGAGALGDGGSAEDQDPLFTLADGATLSNVVIGAPAADGVHCLGTCTLRNVWWLDVGEDAATFEGTSAGQTMSVVGGGAKHAENIVFQHNGRGTVVITDFEAEDIGKLYRSCGDCATQFARRVRITDVTVTAPVTTLAGINPNLGDTATITRATLIGGSDKSICALYKGVTTGEPTAISDVPDSDACKAVDITLN
jgi:hypothetical protein